MELTYQDELAYERDATVDRAHAVNAKEYVRRLSWKETDGDHATYVDLEIIGFVVNLVCKPVGTDGAWNVHGVMSNFTILMPGEFLQPVERVVFMWTRKDYDMTGHGRGTEAVTSTAVDYVNTVGEHYQPTARHCAQVVQTYMNRIDHEFDLDPTKIERGDNAQVSQGS